MTGMEQVTTAVLVGLLGGVHCVGMCGGIVTTLTLGIPGPARARWADLFSYQLAYNLGRLTGYGIAGALMGGLGQMLAAALPIQYAQRMLYGIAALFMIALGLYLGGWWSGLARLERWGRPLWVRLEPLGRRLFPIRSPLHAAGIGLIWAWIPCGLVYSVLIWAIASGGAMEGAVLLLAFGLGTLPTLLGLGMLAGAAARLREQVWIRRIAGALVLGFGIYGSWQVFSP